MPRPPSTQAHEAVLETALKLISDDGIEGTSVDAISEASGVSKATIYKHWENKEALCLEAIGRLKPDLPVFHTEHPRADAVALLNHLARSQKPEALGRIWPRIMTYAASHPEFAKAFRSHICDERHAQINDLLQRAISRGELASGLDVDLAVDLLIGPVMYRRFMQENVSPSFAERVVDAYWRSHAARAGSPEVDAAQGLRPQMRQTVKKAGRKKILSSNPQGALHIQSPASPRRNS